MKTSDSWESVILLVSAMALIPIWLAQSRGFPMPGWLLSVLQVLQFVLLVVLITILIRRIRRVVAEFRKNRIR